jgi:hypothetical protein
MSTRPSSLEVLVVLVYCLLFLGFLGGSIGWVRNIIAVAHSDFSSIDGMTVVRVIGIPAAPVGAVVGWIPQ